MSEWRTKVPHCEWRVKKARCRNGDCIFYLQARVWDRSWETFGEVDMDCAGKGWGADIAKQIVLDHNQQIKS